MAQQDREPGRIPQYTPKDLGIDPVDLAIFRAVTTIADYRKAIALGLAGVLLAAGGFLILQNGEYMPVQARPDSPAQPSKPITPLTRPERAREMIDQLTNPSGQTFRKVMSSLGHEVGQMQDQTYMPGRGIAGKKGLLRRNYPSAEDTRVVFGLGKWLGVDYIYAGTRVSWDGEIDVKTEGKKDDETDDIVDRFGLMINDNPQDERFLFIRLGQKIGQGDWDWFVEQLPRIGYVYLPDGSRNFGKGIIGPSPVEAARLNKKYSS